MPVFPLVLGKYFVNNQLHVEKAQRMKPKVNSKNSCFIFRKMKTRKPPPKASRKPPFRLKASPKAPPKGRFSAESLGFREAFG